MIEIRRISNTHKKFIHQISSSQQQENIDFDASQISSCSINLPIDTTFSCSLM
jgi:hypothetical protein